MKTDLNESLKSIIKSSMKKYRHDYDYLGNISTILNRGVIFTSPDVALSARKSGENHLEKLGEILEMMHHMPNGIGSSNIKTESGRDPYKVYSDEFNKSAKVIIIDSTYRPDDKVEGIYVFDHEVGHMVATHNVNLTDNECESVADAFAMLMHFKRFGKDSKDAERLSRIANFSIMDDSFDHFTLPVTQAVIELNEQIDISKLTAKEVVWYAHEITKDFALPETKLASLSNYFSNREGSLSDERLAQKTLSRSDDADVLRCGANLINDLVSYEAIDKESPFWRSTLSQLKEELDFNGCEINYAKADTKNSIARMVKAQKKLSREKRLYVKFM